MAGNESLAAVDMHYGTLYRYCFPFVPPLPRLSPLRPRRRRRRSAFDGSKRTLLSAIAWHRVANSVLGFRRIRGSRDTCALPVFKGAEGADDGCTGGQWDALGSGVSRDRCGLADQES